jgi:hypothetical protein
MNRIMPILNTALQAALYIPDREDQDLCEYFRSLREVLLECITCMIHCVKDANQLQILNNYAQNIIHFVFQLSNDKYDITVVRKLNKVKLLGHGSCSDWDNN